MVKFIGRDQLTKHVRTQLSMLDSAETSFTREKLEVVDNEATEVLRQIAIVTTRHFAILRRTWNIERLGKYVWRDTDQGWRIKEVEVLKETVTCAGTRFIMLLICSLLVPASFLFTDCTPMPAPFDLVITGGRVVVPKTALDGVRDIGIHDRSARGSDPGSCCRSSHQSTISERLQRILDLLRAQLDAGALDARQCSQSA